MVQMAGPYNQIKVLNPTAQNTHYPQAGYGVWRV